MNPDGGSGSTGAICCHLLVGDQPHDGPVFGEHLRPDQDAENGEDLEEEVLGEVGDALSAPRWAENAGGRRRRRSHPQVVFAEGLQQLLVVPVAHLPQQRQQTRHKLPLRGVHPGQFTQALDLRGAATPRRHLPHQYPPHRPHFRILIMPINVNNGAGIIVAAAAPAQFRIYNYFSC